MSSDRENGRFKMGIIFIIAFVGFSMSTGWALNKALSFKLLETYTHDSFVIGSILAIQGIVGVIVPVWMGYYSDTFKSNRGRRKVFILWGSLITALTLAFIYFSFIFHSPLVIFAISLTLFYFFMYFFVAQYRALMPDIIPSGERGKPSGIITFFEWGGNLALFTFVAVLSIMASDVAPSAKTGIEALIRANYLWIPFATVGIFVVLSGLLLFWKIREPSYPKVEPEEHLLEYVKNILLDHDFVSFYLSQIMWWLSFEFVAVFLYGILESILNTEDVLTLGVAIMAIFNVTVLIGALVGGPFYDKIGRRKSIIIGAVIFLIPFLWGWFLNSSVEITAAIGIAGIGWGMLMATSWPVVGDLLNNYEKGFFNGRYYGFFEATKSLPIAIAALLGGYIVKLAGYNYKVLFPVGAMFVIIAIPLIWKMKHLDSPKGEAE